MDSLPATTLHAELTIKSNCGPTDNDDDDEADETATVIWTPDRTGNTGVCSRKPPTISDEENDEAIDEEEEEEAEELEDDEDMDHSTMMVATHNQLAQHGFGLHLQVDGMAESANTSPTNNKSKPLRTTRRPGKVEFVRFDSKETVYLTEPNEEHGGPNNHHQNELVRNKIKEEIKRWVQGINTVVHAFKWNTFFK